MSLIWKPLEGMTKEPGSHINGTWKLLQLDVLLRHTLKVSRAPILLSTSKRDIASELIKYCEIRTNLSDIIETRPKSSCCVNYPVRT
jgi:hypothetical protein